MVDLNVQKQQIISELKRAYPELTNYSDEQILSIYNQKLDKIKLAKDEQNSIMSGKAPTFSQTGLTLEKQPIKLTSEQENQLKEVLKQRINSVTAKTKEAEKNNGWIGKAWSWAKNIGGFGDSSDDIRNAQKEDLKALESGKLSEAFTKITGLEYTEENLNKFLNNEILTKSEQALEGYKEGQNMTTDFVGDLVSGIAAVGIYTAAVAAAPVTGGASIAVGVAAAAASGTLIKAGVKALDTVGTDKKYDSFGHDLATGAFSGVLAPITGGLGGAVGKTVATKVGVQAVKQVGKEVAEEAAKGGIKQTLKTALINPTGYEYVGGNLAQRTTALGLEMATDGALGGAIDGGFRAGLDNDWDSDAILNGTLSGGIGGAIGAPVIGGGMKAMCKGVQKAFGKNNVHIDTEGNIVNKKVLELGNLNPKYLEELGDFGPATSARGLIKQLKTQGIDTKNYDIKTLLKNCKTEEDFQKTSILLNNLSKDKIYYARELQTIAKDIDDAVILKMLLDKDLRYDYEPVLAKIKENPLLFDVYKEFIPMLKNRGQDNSICVLKRTIAEKLKTQEQCDAFLHLTKEYDCPIEIEHLYHKGFVPENIDDAKSFMTILNYGNHYQPDKDIFSAYLTLPKETRSVLDRFLNSENALYKDTCYSILENLKQEDTRDILTQFIKNSTDADDLRNKYTHVQEAFKNDELAKASIDRINRLESTGIKYDRNLYSYLIHKRAVNKFDVSDPYFNRLIEILNDDILKSKLGRVMTLDEAMQWEQIYQKHQQNFVLSKLSPEITEVDTSKILREAQYLQNEEQIPLAEILLRQDEDIVLHENMWSGKLQKSSLYNSLRTKEDIDAFIKLCNRLPLEDDRLAQIYGHILNSNENIALKIEYAEKIPELLRQDLGECISNIKNKHQADVLIELDKFLYKFRNLSGDIQSFINHNLPEINDAETVNVIRKNLNAIIDSNDEEFKNLFTRSYNDHFEFRNFIQNQNLNFANFNKIKHLRQSSNDNWILLKSMECDSELIDLLLKNKESIDNIGYIINEINPNNTSLVKRLYSNDNFPKEHITLIARNVNKDNLTLVEKLCADREFPKEHIAKIAQYTTKDNLALVEKLCADREFPKEHIAGIARCVNKDNFVLAEIAIDNKAIKRDKLSSILESCKIHDANDAGRNNGKIDVKKVARYAKFLQDPTTSPFVVKLINDGLNMHDIALLAHTRRLKQTYKNANPQTAQITKNLSQAENETISHLLKLGLNEKEAIAILKAISKDGNIDYELEQVAVNLIQKGVAKNKIGDIINSAKITGEFNPKIVDDFVSLQNIGLNPLLEKNIAIINNISPADVAVKFNSKVKNQLKAMLERLPEPQKQLLTTKGIDTEDLIKKLEMKIVRTSDKVPTKAKVVSGMRSKSSISGFERILVDKYSPVEKIWRNADATRNWAEEKYLSFKNQEYISTRQSAQEAGLPEKITNLRAQKLKEWYDFLETDETIKNDPFARTLIAEFITKDLLPENSSLPPELDKALIKEILGSAANSKDFSIGNVYSKRTAQAAKEKSGGEVVEFDGIRGTWYTVPKTDSSHPKFKENAAKIRAFSDGTNWCIRTWNAEPYLQQGDMHFFVDENGLTQICIRENAPKEVAEIQKRQQNATRPIPYINGIKQFLDKHEIKAPLGYLDDALKAKPAFDKLKSECTKLVQEKNYKAILERMGIEVKVLEDGTWEISHYTPKLEDFVLNDLGIKESDLLEKVSIIRGNADFKDSNVSTLANLHTIFGDLKYDESHFFAMPKIESINGCKIEW